MSFICYEVVMSRQSLLEYGRGWLCDQGGEGKEEWTGGDAVFYSMSVSPLAYPPTTFWTGRFNIHMENITVRLHSHDNDPELVLFFNKLNLLEQGVREYCKAFRKVLNNPKKPLKEPVYKRQWLNPENIEAPFTGHYFYFIDQDKAGRFCVGDCHRTIVMWMNIHHNDGMVFNKALLEVQLSALQCLVTYLKEAQVKIKSLRKQCKVLGWDKPQELQSDTPSEDVLPDPQ